MPNQPPSIAPTHRKVVMNKIVSLALLIGGVVLIIAGINASNSFSSDVSRFFTGSPTDKSILDAHWRHRRRHHWPDGDFERYESTLMGETLVLLYLLLASRD